jgi:cytochrome c553
MKKIVIASIAALAVSSTLMAAVPASCVGCHGADGSKNTVKKDLVPNKLSAADITKKLNAFKAGTEGTVMKGMAKSLTDAQIKEVATAWGKK